MGNAIEKKYDVPKEYTATAGHLQLWKIWPGKSKDASGRLVSIWAFDKGELINKKTVGAKSAVSNLTLDKTAVEQIYQIMKKDMTMTKETQACPSLISSIEIIEDSKNGLAFTTERIVCSLADILNNFEYIPGGYIHHSEFFEGSNTVSEMEISRAMLMMSEGLLFMHNVQKKLHCNITPESVVITANGHWKLCGFGFSLSFQQGDLQRVASPYFLKAVNNVNQTQSLIRLEPDLRYSSPEMTEGGYNPPGVRYLAPAHDVFSLGLVMYEVYRFNLKMTPNERSSFRSFLTIINNDASQYSASFDQMRYIDYSFLPLGIDRLLGGLLQSNHQQRLTATDITTNPFYVSGNQAIISSIEKLHTKDIGAQTTQLMTLQGQLDSFPPRLLKFTVLPSIGKLCVSVPSLWEYGLPIFQSCGNIFSREQFQAIAGQYFAAGMALNSSIETMQAFLQSLPFIIDSFSVSFFQINATILFCNALEKQHALLQNLTFEKLWDDGVQSRLEGAQLTEKLVPQLCKEACKNPDSNVKIQALFIISHFLRKLDKAYIVANILPSLKYIADNDRTSTISLHVVGCYEVVSDVLGHEHIASSILPSILPLVIDRTMDRKQFETIISLVKTMMKKMCEPRTIELRMDAVSFGEEIDRSSIDPFSAAKTALNNTRNLYRPTSYDPNAAAFSETHGLTRLGGVPPVPGLPPPPPPSLPPPPPPPSQPAPTPELNMFGSSNNSAPPPVPSIPPPPLPSSAPYSSPNVPSIPPPFPAASSSFSFGVPTVPPSVPPPIPVTPSPVASNTSASVASKIEGFGSSSIPSPSVPAAAPSSSSTSTKSSFSWFSSKSSKPVEKEPEYQPPTVNVNPPSSTSNGTGLDSSIDLDDFMNSLAQSKKSVPSSVPVQSTAVYSAPIQSQTVALSLEEQLKQTQEQIAKLSSTISSGSSMSSSIPPPIPPPIPPSPTPSYNPVPAPSQNMYSTAPSSTYPVTSTTSAYTAPSVASKSAVSTAPASSANINMFPSNVTAPNYGPTGGAFGSSGTIPSFKTNSVGMQTTTSTQPASYGNFNGFTSSNNYASSTSTTSNSANIGNLPKSTGYMPPVMPVPSSAPSQPSSYTANVGMMNGNYGNYTQQPTPTNNNMQYGNNMFMGMNVTSGNATTGGYNGNQMAYGYQAPQQPFGQQMQSPQYGQPQQHLYNNSGMYPQQGAVPNNYMANQQSNISQNKPNPNISSAFDFMN